jgi:predicted MFS family arabinose efflux permease
MGVLGGGYHPSSPPLVSALVEPRRRGWALGLHMLGGSASHFVAPLIAAAITVTWGWRSPFIILAVPTMVFGIVYYIFLGRLADIKRAEPEIISGHEQKPTSPHRSRHLVFILILSIFSGSVIFSTSSFIPLFVVDEFGFSKEAAAAIIAVFYFTGLWASPLGGYLSDRLGGVPVLLIACFAAGPFIYLLNLASNGWGIGAVLVIIGITMYIRMPVSESYIVSKTSERHRSSILGIYYFGNLEGVGVMTPVIGYLIDRFGFYLSFTIIGAALVAVTLVCSIWLRGSRD